MTTIFSGQALFRNHSSNSDFSWMNLAACTWVGLFPLLHFGTYTTLTRDKWIIMFILTFLTIMCTLADGIQHRLAIPARLPLLLGGLLLGWIFLSNAFSEYDADIWWIGGSARREGLITQLCYLLLFFCFSCAHIQPEHLMRSAATGINVFFVIVMLQRAGGNPFGLYPEGTSFALNPEFQGSVGNTDMCTGYLCLMFGLFASWFSAFLSKQKNHKFQFLPPSGSTMILCLWSLCLSILLLVEMDIQFGFIALFAMTFFLLLSFLPPKARILLLILLLILTLLLVWFWQGSSGAIWEFHEILHARSQPSFGHNRIAVWQYSLTLAKESLFLGGGSDTFEQRFNAWLRNNGAVIPTQQGKTLLPSYFDNPHNEYLAQLVNHGLPALLFFLALILTALFHPCARHSCFRLAIFGYAVQAFFSFSVCIVSPIFWTLLGICCTNRAINVINK